MKQSIQEMSDGERVVLVAEVLATSEFDLFQRAYHDWYGHEAELRALEHEFVQYLYFGSTPPWVRHYTRMQLDQHADAVITRPRSLGISGAWLRLMDSRVGRYLLS